MNINPLIRYLVILKEGSSGIFYADALTPGDLELNNTGLSEIIDLQTGTFHQKGHWLPIPIGVLATPDIDGEQQNPVHTLPDEDPRSDGLHPFTLPPANTPPPTP